MPKRRDNMLEAFRASVEEDLRARKLRESAAQEADTARGGVDAPVRRGRQRQGAPTQAASAKAAPTQAPPPAPQAPVAARRAGSAPPPSTPQPLAPVRAEDRLAAEPDGLTLPLGGLAFLGVLAVMLGLAFGLGWLSGREPGDGTSLAGGPGASELRDGGLEFGRPLTRGQLVPGQVPTTPASAPPPAGGTTPDATAGAIRLSDADRALADPANRYTVLALTHNNGSRGRQYMEEAHAELLRNGFPVCRPIEHKGHLLLFVGAEPTDRALGPLVSGLTALRNPRGTGAYLNGPYPVKISPYAHAIPGRPEADAGGR